MAEALYCSGKQKLNTVADEHEGTPSQVHLAGFDVGFDEDLKRDKKVFTTVMRMKDHTDPVLCVSQISTLALKILRKPP